MTPTFCALEASFPKVSAIAERTQSSGSSSKRSIRSKTWPRKTNGDRRDAASILDSGGRLSHARFWRMINISKHSTSVFTNHALTASAFIKELTGVSWHRFAFGEAANRTYQH